VELWRLTALAGNLYCLNLAVGSLAWLASALSDRRGRAVSVVVAFVLLSFLLSYLAPFWNVAEQLSFLSVLHYYIPLEVLRDGLFPLRDILVLGGLAAALWTAAGLIFVRRDLATV
jgi:multisubunit Na+/H+ antiporter MnhB subunit